MPDDIPNQSPRRPSGEGTPAVEAPPTAPAPDHEHPPKSAANEARGTAEREPIVADRRQGHPGTRPEGANRAAPEFTSWADLRHGLDAALGGRDRDLPLGRLCVELDPTGGRPRPQRLYPPSKPHAPSPRAIRRAALVVAFAQAAAPGWLRRLHAWRPLRPAPKVRVTGGRAAWARWQPGATLAVDLGGQPYAASRRRRASTVTPAAGGRP